MNASISTFDLNALIEPYRVYRIGPFSAPDALGAYGVAALLAPLLIRGFRKLGIETTFWEWMALVLPIAFLAHVAFGVDTAFTRMFFAEGAWLSKISLFAMTVFGLRGFFRRLRFEISSMVS